MVAGIQVLPQPKEGKGEGKSWRSGLCAHTNKMWAKSALGGKLSGKHVV